MNRMSFKTLTRIIKGYVDLRHQVWINQQFNLANTGKRHHVIYHVSVPLYRYLKHKSKDNMNTVPWGTRTKHYGN